MKTATTRSARLALALVAALSTGSSIAATALPAAAQYQPNFNPGQYTGWRPAWDRNQFDRRHVVLGTVANFSAYRLGVTHPDGFVQQVDLKPGTVILPTGGTPQQNQHVAMVGYYSKGTFIVNRLILRNY